MGLPTGLTPPPTLPTRADAEEEEEDAARTSRASISLPPSQPPSQLPSPRLTQPPLPLPTQPPPATPQSYIIDEQAADRLLRQRASTARGSRLEAISNNPADRARQRMVATAPGGRLDAATADSLLRHGMSSSTDPTPGDAPGLTFAGMAALPNAPRVEPSLARLRGQSFSAAI